ncbi:MmgE/PrpD family protein [Lichenicoccus sp.]|uniref:MmgE/PrpD family protein n=1 Tax=Lichenicoccus sp. TaxID=2781899 RepID=UPI003D0D9F19
MSEAAVRSESQIEAATPTARLITRLDALSAQEPPVAAAAVAKQCLLDWIGVSLAGRHEPLVNILMDELALPNRPDGCAVLGRSTRLRIDDAVLINGAMGHALDFDDVIIPMGHPTVPVAPVVFALAEHGNHSGQDVIAAFIVGVEAECRVSHLMGPSHYARGWHGTATFGTFGAAMAACRLLGVSDPRTIANAFGIAATQAAGLKASIGTMCKPLHAGKAAQNGLLAARLAARGFTSDPDTLGSPQGFADTASTTVDLDGALAERNMPWIAQALFKYHAACYLTHDTIEAANMLRIEETVLPAAIERVTVRVPRDYLRICNIAEPATGLECKFSLRMTAAMALAGEDTFDETLFSDATARRADLVALRDRVMIDPTQTGRASSVEVVLKDGRTLVRTSDVSQPLADLDAQQAKVERKFRHLTRSILSSNAVDEVIALCRALEAQPNLQRLISLIG